MTISCIHNISWINGCNFVKLAWIYDWESWLDFDDLGLILMITGELKRKFLVPIYLLNACMKVHAYIIDTSLRANYIFVTLISFPRSREHLDIIIFPYVEPTDGYSTGLHDCIIVTGLRHVLYAVTSTHFVCRISLEPVNGLFSRLA